MFSYVTYLQFRIKPPASIRIVFSSQVPYIVNISQLSREVFLPAGGTVMISYHVLSSSSLGFFSYQKNLSWKRFAETVICWPI